MTSELRDRGVLAYSLKEFSGALCHLQAYLQRTSGTANARERADDDDHAQIWEHVKEQRKRVASLN